MPGGQLGGSGGCDKNVLGWTPPSFFATLCYDLETFLSHLFPPLREKKNHTDDHPPLPSPSKSSVFAASITRFWGPHSPSARIFFCEFFNLKKAGFATSQRDKSSTFAALLLVPLAPLTFPILAILQLVPARPVPSTEPSTYFCLYAPPEIQRLTLQHKSRLGAFSRAERTRKKKFRERQRPP